MFQSCTTSQTRVVQLLIFKFSISVIFFIFGENIKLCYCFQFKTFFSLTKAPAGPPKLYFTCSNSHEAIEKSVQGIEHLSLAI